MYYNNIMLYDQTNCEKKNKIWNTVRVFEKERPILTYTYFIHIYYNIVFNIRILYNLQIII